MEFKLSDEIIGQIIFAMENQQQRFFIDPCTGMLLQAEDLEAGFTEDANPYVEIPVWRPVDGFRLMERFVAQLRNPVFRERLKNALASGSGVFRNFKSTVKQNSEIEKLWYQFKEKSMRRVVRRWYNQQRELAGLEQLGPEPEETEDLLLSDFIIREAGAEDLPALSELDRIAFAETFTDIASERVEILYRRRWGEADVPAGGIRLVAEAPDGRLAGFVWAEEAEDCAGRETLALVQLAVAELFRGLGLGRLLAERLLAEASHRGRQRVQVALCGNGLETLPLFKSLGFTPCEQILEYRGD